MTPEAKVLKAVTAYLDELRDPGWPLWYTKLHGSPMQQKGLPDLLIVCDGRAVFMEIKKPGGKATKLQAHTLSKLRAAGATASVVTSVEEARGCLYF